MRVVRRRLFWKVYLTLLASLFVTAFALGVFVWFLGEAQREVGQGSAAAWPAEVTQYAADGHLVAARGQPIEVEGLRDRRHRVGNHVVRFDLPDGSFILTRFLPPPGVRAVRLLAVILAVAGGVGLAAYPLTALLTRRLEALRRGVASWGETRAHEPLDERGSDEVALLARAFNEAAGRLDALLASQRALLANASHELRSPLARLRMAIELERPASSAQRSGEILRNLAEMDQLVGELLLSSRLDHGERHGDRLELVDLLGLAAEEASRYEAVVTGEPVEVAGDPILLRRLIRNLLDNGTRHGQPPTTITITRSHDGATLTVHDEGNGVVPADRARIFDAFYRPAGSSERSGGWGLGLALVRQIAERHGGRAECRPRADGGSYFVVNLAARPPAM